MVVRRPMSARDTSEPHRASTPLELFFDLCFVVAVAAVAAELHHAVVEAHVADGLVGYVMVFFAIWWAWMNFTWFASAYDNDDIVFRLAVFVMITGALILAAGVPRAFEDTDFGVVTLGYVVMRAALVPLWLRAARHDPARARTDRTMALGVTVVQIGWVLLLLVPRPWSLVGFVTLVVAELAVPFIAEGRATTPWHPGHIAERYSLFTLIVLGESVLAGSVALGAGLDSGGLSAVWPIALGGLLIVFSLWWTYFARSAEGLLTNRATAFRWGYGHLVVFGSAAAVGAGLAANVDVALGVGAIGVRGAAAFVTIPVALYLFTVWALHLRPHERGSSVSRQHSVVLGVGVVLVLAATFSPQPVLVTGLVTAATVAVAQWLDLRDSEPGDAER
jgi:low temperature requirement protein LtrA